MASPSQLTPALRQYLEIKAQHPDAILLYRMGDFYEAFFEDAERAAPVLDVVLTARHRGTEHEAPMCGIPYHALDGYLKKLLHAGFKVALCDQMEDASQAKGLVRREVTRVVTPGTVSDAGLLDGGEANLLASLVWRGEQGAGAFLDVSTGSFFVRRWSAASEGLDDLRLLRPREALVAGDGLPVALAEWVDREVACRTDIEPDRWFAAARGADVLAAHLGTATLRGYGLEEGEPAVEAAASALRYAQETQQSELPHVRSLEVRETRRRLVLDATTVSNLEIFRNQRDGGREGTLLAVLDQSQSPPGGRLLRDWLARPLRDPAAVERRLDAVEELLGDGERRVRLRAGLRRLGDPERLAARGVLGTLAPREAAALRDALADAPALLADLSGARSPLLAELGAADPQAELAGELARVLVAEPPAQLKEGGVIADGVDAELDGARSLARDSKRHILELERKERQRTGIASLKIRFNKVFGYYVEVTKANQHLVPDDYIRKQTLVNAERYVTPEIKELEERILSAEGRQLELETTHFDALRRAVAARAADVGRLAQALAAADVLAAFAEAAARNHYTRPRVTASGDPLEIREGRHPVVERSSREGFVPNDTDLDAERAQICVLTGPNMGGKSTYLRQVALIVVMAQAGSFVPARSARLGAVDRVFTRVGASDDLARGESTFMVEMIETANILHAASDESLVVLDEVGRGTATFDGLSLAWAIVEHLHERCRARTLFATHYHELTELAALLPRVVNRTMAVKEWEDRILFLRRVVPGSADKSYGLHVARLAGIPEGVVQRAAEILANLEAHEYDLAGRPRLARGRAPEAPGPDQLQLFAPPEEVVASVLREVDVNRLSPLAALNLIQTLKKRLG